MSGLNCQEKGFPAGSLGARLGFSVSVVELDSLEYNSLPLGGQSPLAKLLGKVNHDLVPPLRATGAPDAGRSGARLPRPRVQGISQRSWAVHPAETWSWHLSGITQSLGFVPLPRSPRPP